MLKNKLLELASDAQVVEGTLEIKAAFEDWLEEVKGYDLGALYVEFTEYRNNLKSE